MGPDNGNRSGTADDPNRDKEWPTKFFTKRSPPEARQLFQWLGEGEGKELAR